MTEDGHQSSLQSRITSCPERSTTMVTRIVLQIRICAFEIRRRVFASSLQTFPCKSSNSFLFPLFLFSSRLFYYSLRVVAPVSFNNEKKRIKGKQRKGMKSVGGRKNYRPFYRLTLLSGLSRITGASLRDIMRTKRLSSRLVLMSSHARCNCVPLEIEK